MNRVLPSLVLALVLAWGCGSEEDSAGAGAGGTGGSSGTGGGGEAGNAGTAGSAMGGTGGAATGGTGGSATGGTGGSATGGTGGSATGGTGGSATGGTGGAATGGTGGSATGGTGGSNTGGSTTGGAAGSSTGGTAGAGGEPDVHVGEGTYYDADGSGNCSFDPSPNDLMVAAMNNADYANSAVCGGCILVTGPNGSVTVRIVDRCPECAPGDVDLSAEAFALIANPVDGRVAISWYDVACDVNGPIVYRFKEGSSQWWTAIQVRNTRWAVSTLEVKVNGAYQAIPRESYNYFVESGLGVGPYDIRVTDVWGHVLEDTGIPLGDGSLATGAGQFPP